MSSQLRKMEDLARSYCELVEAASERDETWIQQVAGLLPQLHMAITALGGVPDDVSTTWWQIWTHASNYTDIYANCSGTEMPTGWNSTPPTTSSA